MFEVNTKNGKGKLVHLAGIRGKSSMGLMTLQGTKKGTANLFMGYLLLRRTHFGQLQSDVWDTF